MRTLKSLLTSATTLVLLAGFAPIQAAQDPIKVEVTSKHEVWYLDPLWLVIGGVVLLLVIILAVMAGRGSRDTGSTTTVVR